MNCLQGQPNVHIWGLWHNIHWDQVESVNRRGITAIQYQVITNLPYHPLLMVKCPSLCVSSQYGHVSIRGDEPGSTHRSCWVCPSSHALLGWFGSSSIQRCKPFFMYWKMDCLFFRREKISQWVMKSIKDCNCIIKDYNF